jgi:NAD dependent epimerase/dehydratase family enzyme
MGESLLLGGQRVSGAALTDSGFEYRHGDLEPALRKLLGR